MIKDYFRYSLIIILMSYTSLAIGQVSWTQYSPLNTGDNPMGSTGEPSEWLWDFGDGNTSNIQHPSHTYNNTGQYTVKLRIKNGFYTDSIHKLGYIIVSLNGDIEFYSATELKVFPNPNNGRFTLDLKTSGSKTFNLRVYNTIGKQVYAKKIDIVNDALISVDLSTLSKGVYFIRIDNKHESLNRKVIID